MFSAACDRLISDHEERVWHVGHQKPRTNAFNPTTLADQSQLHDWTVPGSTRAQCALAIAASPSAPDGGCALAWRSSPKGHPKRISSDIMDMMHRIVWPGRWRLCFTVTGHGAIKRPTQFHRSTSAVLCLSLPAKSLRGRCSSVNTLDPSMIGHLVVRHHGLPEGQRRSRSSERGIMGVLPPRRTYASILPTRVDTTTSRHQETHVTPPSTPPPGAVAVSEVQEPESAWECHGEKRGRAPARVLQSHHQLQRLPRVLSKSQSVRLNYPGPLAFHAPVSPLVSAGLSTADGGLHGPLLLRLNPEVGWGQGWGKGVPGTNPHTLPGWDPMIT
ncbi:hypothetical protein DPEC_G00137420 [Dallia pectoralis]|uniref:Uncharacterized protein n=1 Tax=Dallia pectoralis TaxID=75939 RepID=A0ACC2GLQ7_DALPE|nr:hypothetical protein DPEC_G00137420 [Dallia pectoralis]